MRIKQLHVKIGVGKDVSEGAGRTSIIGGINILRLSCILSTNKHFVSLPHILIGSNIEVKKSGNISCGI